MGGFIIIFIKYFDEIHRWRMTEGGLECDRQWMVMQGNKVLTQKRDPLLSQIKTFLDMESKILTLSFR